MFQYIVRRALWAWVMLMLVAASVFIIFFVLPGGTGKKLPGGHSVVAVMMAGKNPRPELIENIEHRLGLDQPVTVQFGRYIWRLLHGDLGYSYQSNQPVLEALMNKLPATASLAIGSSIIWLVLGVSAGVLSAVKRRTLIDRTSMVLALIFLSMPTFWLGLLAIFFFGGTLDMYEPGSYESITSDPIQWFKAMWLPWLVLSLTDVAVYSRIVRSTLLEVEGEDYVRTARAKGLKERSVLRHELRSVLTPVVTMYGLDLGILLGGAIITERIFNIPGIGAYAVQAITSSNLPVILGTTLLAAFFIIIANLIVDIVYAFLDPRVVYR